MKFKLYTGKQSVQPSENGATYYLFMDLMRNYLKRSMFFIATITIVPPSIYGSYAQEQLYRKDISDKLKKTQSSNRGTQQPCQNGH